MTRAMDVLIASFNGRVFGVDPDGGQVLWTYECVGKGWPARLLLDGDRIYAADAEYTTACLDRATGKLLWSVRASAAGKPSLLVRDGRLFVARSGEVECYDASGKRLWHNPFKGMGGGAVSLALGDEVANYIV